MQDMKRCERSALGTLDTTLRNACGEPATYGLYDRETFETLHYVCSQHIGHDDFGVVGLTYDAVRASRAGLSSPGFRTLLAHLGTAGD